MIPTQETVLIGPLNTYSFVVFFFQKAKFNTQFLTLTLLPWLPKCGTVGNIPLCKGRLIRIEGSTVWFSSYIVVKTSCLYRIIFCLKNPTEAT